MSDGYGVGSVDRKTGRAISEFIMGHTEAWQRSIDIETPTTYTDYTTVVPRRPCSMGRRPDQRSPSGQAALSETRCPRSVVQSGHDGSHERHRPDTHRHRPGRTRMRLGRQRNPAAASAAAGSASPARPHGPNTPPTLSSPSCGQRRPRSSPRYVR